MLDDDLASIFADTSVFVAVAYGTDPDVQVTRGSPTTEDVPEPDGMDGIVLVSRRVVTIADGSLTNLRKNQSITVDGVSYVIHDIRSAGRGKTRVVFA